MVTRFPPSCWCWDNGGCFLGSQLDLLGYAVAFHLLRLQSSVCFFSPIHGTVRETVPGESVPTGILFRKNRISHQSVCTTADWVLPVLEVLSDRPPAFLFPLRYCESRATPPGYHLHRAQGEQGWVCLQPGAVLVFATFLLKRGTEDVLVWEIISKSTQGLQ